MRYVETAVDGDGGTKDSDGGAKDNGADQILY